jgi:farnesol dehydrogenase
VNVGGLRNVLDVTATRGVPRLIYTSSFLALPPADGDAPLRANDYQRTKIDAEWIAAEAASAGRPIVRLYPGVVYGPGKMTEGNLVGRLLADHVRGRLPGLIGADRVWSFACVDDVAAGHVAALERGRAGAQYRLGGENLPQMRPFEILQEWTGRPLPRRIPYAVATAIGLVEEMRVQLFGGTPKLTRGTVDIFRHDWPLDSREAMRDLGYTITPLREGLARTMDWT